MDEVTTFDKHADEYDHWFDENGQIYQAEVSTLQRFVPTTSFGLEVGVGTGRFSTPFDIRIGVEPARRVLRVGGQIIIGFIDRDTPLGQVYESRKDSDRFYQTAHFYSVPEIAAYVHQAGFGEIQFAQTILGVPSDDVMVYQVHSGYGKGAFVAVTATKQHGDKV